MNRISIAAVLLSAVLLAGCDPLGGRVYGSVSWTVDVSDVDFTSIGMPSSVIENERYEVRSGKHTVTWRSSCCSGVLTQDLTVKGGEELAQGFLNESGDPKDRVYDWTVSNNHVYTQRNELVDDGSTD